MATKLLRLCLALLILAPLALVQASPAAAAATTAVFSDSLGQGWEDSSWDGTATYDQGNVVRSGGKAIAWTPSSTRGDWAAFSMSRSYRATAFDTSPYTNFRFYILGDSGSKAKKFGVSLNGSDGPRVDIGKYITGGSISGREWRLVDIPLDVLSAQGGQIGRITIQDISGAVQPPTYFDDIEFYNNGAPPPPPLPPAKMTVNIDASAGVHSISPYIYGIANSAGATSWQKQMGVSLVRWGGNARSRHNWEINASNAGSDWGPYLNVDQLSGNRTAGKASVDFVNANKAVGADSLITIPTLGWVAKDTSSESTGVPSQGGAAISPGSGAIAGYDPSSNRSRTSVPSYPKKPTPFSYPPSTSDGAVYQDEWVNYLKSTFGSASSGGVRFYAMDNEPDLWADSTHADVHPVRAGYEETLKRFKDYATAVKAVDPSSQILGPVGWGWLSLWYSGLDIGSDNYSSAPDRAAHGNVPFYAWFLQQMKAYDQSLGQRTLDVLDVHYYPQGGVFSSSVDSATQAKRLRSTRSLWDPSYADESWQASTEGGPYLRLIPRLKELVSQYYPGTKVGISEWNWGADSNINGALAIADVLGIFGREDLYLANYWTSPEQNSPGYFAFRMFRNYDGSYSSFGDTSLKASVGAADVDKISTYASRDSKSGELKLILINKMPATRADVNLNISNFSPGSSAKVYQYAASDTSQIKRLADVAVPGSSLSYSLAPYSITMLVFSPGKGKVAPSPTSAPSPVSQDAFGPVAPFAGSADMTYFPQTGHSLGYGFKRYWESHGSLEIFGYPVSEEFQEGGYTVQYFERARFEYHPEFVGTAWEVELGLLGRQFAPEQAAAASSEGTTQQGVYFSQTGQYLSNGFKYFWDHSGGLPIFGMPLTGEFSEVNPVDGKTYTVQYFERARFEYHPEFAGTRYEVELGHLGTQALQERGLILR